MKPWQWAALFGLIGAIVMTVRRVSMAGIDNIKQYEKLALKPYQDIGGRWTIGYGHLIKPSEDYLMYPSGITEQQAENLLEQDLTTAESAIQKLVTVPLSSNQYDALVSFVYNVGAGNFQSSTLLRKLNAGDYQGAAAEFPRWHYAKGVASPGLLARREKEQNTFIA